MFRISPVGVLSSEIFYESERSVLVRVRSSRSPRAVRKEARGRYAAQRKRHERAILQRLADVPGVAHVLPGPWDALFLEEIRGPSLAELLEVRCLESEELLDFAERIARVLAGVHRAGIIHGDIVPGNILLAEHGPVLIDFDLAMMFGEQRPSFAYEHEIIGSLPYIAPEQSGRTGHSVDQRADLYALGVVLYEAAVGRLPFDAQDPLQLLHDHLARVPAPPAELNRALPGGISDIILRLLEKEPEQRYQSAEGLAYDLAALRKALERGVDRLAALGKHDFPLRLSSPSCLIGREAEIAALRGAFETALRERRRSIFVSGPAGVGKTVLINELRSIVAAEHGWFIVGKFDQYRNDVASGAVFEALRALGRFLLAEPDAKLAGRRAALLEALGSNAGLVASLIPEASVLLGELAQTPLSDPANAEKRLCLALLAFLRSVASLEKPIVLVLDDLQWADSTSIGFIEEVLNDADLRGLLLVGAYRQTECDAAHAFAGLAAHWEQREIIPPILRLGALATPDLSRLLAEMLRVSPQETKGLAEAVGAHTHGNPYYTVELINELRNDGLLTLGDGGWRWDETGVRRYVGRAEVVDLLAARIFKVPEKARELLLVMACLGGQIELGCLAVASGLDMGVLEAALPAALEAGLLLLGEEASFRSDSLVRFRHDRVQQAAHMLLGARRESFHLEIARRLAGDVKFAARAASQYLAACALLVQYSECKRAIGLFREAASRACLATDYLGGEQFLSAAAKLSETLGIALSDPDRLALEDERHAVLYSLGRYDEADACYAVLESHIRDPIALSGAVCRQITAFFRRRRLREAIALGIAMLRRLDREPVFGSLRPDVSKELDAFYRWFSEIDLDRELRRPEPTEPRVLAALGIMKRLQMPAIYADPVLADWMTFESRRLWELHGPCALLVANICMASATLIELRSDYRTTYDVLRFAIAVGEARGYEPMAAWAWGIFATTGAHWAEPLEECLAHGRRAYEGIVRGGDVQDASHTFHATYVVLQDCASVDACAAEVEAGLSFALRTGGGQLVATFIVHQQLIRALRGQTERPGSLNDASFNEESYLAEIAGNVAPMLSHHLTCAMTGAIFGDTERLIRHAQAVRSVLAASALSVQGMYRPAALGNLVWALATAERLRGGGLAAQERRRLLAELDEAHAWFTQRAVDAPANYAHLASFIEAERAWSLGDPWNALAAFDKAREELRRRKRPWHHALITERAGLFHLEYGLQCAGRALLVEAYHLYDDWGAVGKLRQMEGKYALLQSELAASPRQRAESVGGYLSSHNLDMLAILRASQALSSETDLARLRNRIVDLLGEMTGATNVSIALRQGDGQDFFLLPARGSEAGALPVEAAAGAGLLPLSVFRYVLRSREPLLVSDALRDDRFSQDAYFRRLEQCSLFAVPILSQGGVLAVLILENSVSCKVFSKNGLDAVRLIVGQLAVSLENALLYASLAQAYEREKRVARTFQEAALDSHLPCVPGLVLDAVYQPGCSEAQVGGDWYDAFRLPDGRVVLSVGDVSGSGLRAAVAMGSVRQSIRTAALINPDPVAILEAVDRIVRATEREQFVTAFVGVLDPLFFELSYANAGHPPPLLRTPDGAVRVLLQNDSQGDLPLGLRQRDESASASIFVEPGSLLALYTDGLTEFERDPLAGEKKLLESVRGLQNLERPACILYRDVFGDRAQHDDVAILTLTFERRLIAMQDEGLVVRWEFDANDSEIAHAVQRTFVRVLERAGFTPSEFSSAELIFGELLGNVVRYAGGQVTIALDMSAEAPVLHVLDDGDGFEHNQRLPKDLFSEHGRGLFLVTAFAEEASVSRRKDGGSHARAVLCGRIRASRGMHTYFSRSRIAR